MLIQHDKRCPSITPTSAPTSALPLEVMQNSKKCPPNLITFFEDMLNLVFQMGKSEMERKGNFGPSYLSFPVPFRPFQINPAFLSLSEKNGQLSGKGNIAFLSLTFIFFLI